MFLKYIVLNPWLILTNVNSKIETIACKLWCEIKYTEFLKVLYWFIFLVYLEIVWLEIIVNFILTKLIEISVVLNYWGRTSEIVYLKAWNIEKTLFLILILIFMFNRFQNIFTYFWINIHILWILKLNAVIWNFVLLSNILIIKYFELDEAIFHFQNVL